MEFVHRKLNKCFETFNYSLLLRIARMEMDCIVKKINLNLPKFSNYLLGKKKLLWITHPSEGGFMPPKY